MVFLQLQAQRHLLCVFGRECGEHQRGEALQGLGEELPRGMSQLVGKSENSYRLEHLIFTPPCTCPALLHKSPTITTAGNLTAPQTSVPEFISSSR